MALFQKSVLNKYLQEQSKIMLEVQYSLFKSFFLNPTIQKNILASKEEEFQEGFLRELFVKILGYTINPESEFNLKTELKNEKDSKKADGAIIDNDKVLGVIELKSTTTSDLNKIEIQAFNYKNNQKGCTYIITSNFQKIRFYIENAIEFLEWDLFKLDLEGFKLLFFCLCKENIFANLPLQLKTESLIEEENVTKKLYNEYSSFRKSMFQNIVELNPTFDKLLLFKKTQKLLDRFLFLFFAEDRMLVPPNSVRMILEQWNNLKDMDAYQPLYDRFKLYFGYLNTGHKGKVHEIFAYNGGLFAADQLLNSIKIDDNILYNAAITLSRYDYNSDIDVNILGHIFEHSLTEIEEIENEIASNEVKPKTSKRKKDGVFYTPKYITKYIIENTVGTLCEKKKEALNFVEEDFHILSKKEKRKLLTTLEAYKNWLLQITIVDPACGSGAFLNQALEFLIAEHKWLSEMEANITGSSIVFDVESSILENNLFGVDINEESVEIAKLSLWLRTAKKGRKLNSLNNNIKCGNSLIDDVKVAGEKAFNWYKEFPQVFGEYIETEVNEKAEFKFKENTIIDSLNYIDENITGVKSNEAKITNYDDKIVNTDYGIVNEESVKNYTSSELYSGFDVVIGNPPYVDIKALPNLLVLELFKKYKTAENRINLYSLFIERAYNLLKPNGLLGFINPNSMLLNSSYTKLRKLIIDEIYEIIKLPDNVFPDAKVETILMFLRKNTYEQNINLILYKRDEKIEFIDVDRVFIKNKIEWKQTNDKVFNIQTNDQVKIILRKIEVEKKTLSELASFSLGITPYDKYKGHTEELIKNREFHSNLKLSEEYKPLITGENITRYFTLEKCNEYIKYGDWLGAKRDERFFLIPRILVRQIVSGNPQRIYASYSELPLYFTQIGFGIIANEKIQNKYLLCILNSLLINFYHKFKFLDVEKNLFQKLLIANCKKIPIKQISKESQEPFIEKADLMISKNKELQNTTIHFTKLLNSKFETLNINNKLEKWYTLSFAEFNKELSKQKIKLSLQVESEWLSFFESEKQKAVAINNEIDSTDKEIDKMVYELYELTNEEIKIVEAN